MRNWDPSDIECSRVARISVYGIPCYVRNKNFLEALLSDIGACSNWDPLLCKPLRLDVLSLLIFTNSLEMIRNKTYVCLDGKWINILIVEEETVSMEESDALTEEGCTSSNMDDFTPSESEEKEEENPVGKDQFSNSSFPDWNDSDLSLQNRKIKLVSVSKNKEKSDSIYCPKM